MIRRKPHKDPVSFTVRSEVIVRDGECLAYTYDRAHVCRDRWGVPHSPKALHMLTVDHVHDGYGLMGVRAKSDAKHLVALCWGANVGGPSKDFRAFERAYLARVAA